MDPAPPQPPQVTMGLLDYLNAHTLDEDYQEVARLRGTPTQAKRRPGWRSAIALAAFAVLLIVAAVQTSRSAVSDQHQHNELVSQIQQRQQALASQQRQVNNLRIQTGTLQASVVNANRSSSKLLDQVARLSLITGTTPAQGPGVKIVVSDAPHATDEQHQVQATDLQQLVNGLWQAGAEAIAINGQRLTSLTAIRHAGAAITVNYHSLSGPYTVVAIGDANTLPARFADTVNGQTWLDLHQQVGLGFTIEIEGKVRVPGATIGPLQYVDGGASGKLGSTAPGDTP